MPEPYEMPGAGPKKVPPPGGTKNITDRCPKCGRVHPKGECPKDKSQIIM